MAALSDDRVRHQRNLGSKRLLALPGTASTQFYSGGLVSWNASASTVEPSVDTASERIAGVCAGTILTTSATENVSLEWGHSEWFPHTGIAAGQERKDGVVSDDNTVTDAAAASNDVSVGIIEELATIDGTAGVWITVGVFSGTQA